MRLRSWRPALRLGLVITLADLLFACVSNQATGDCAYRATDQGSFGKFIVLMSDDTASSGTEKSTGDGSFLSVGSCRSCAIGKSDCCHSADEGKTNGFHN